MIRHGESAPARLHHSGLGAVRADADPGAAGRHAGAGLSGRAAIRWRSRARRSICRRGAPAGWRATSSSTSPARSAAILPRIVADRRRRRGRDRVRAGGDRRHRRRRARAAAGARRARAAAAAGAAGARVGAVAWIRARAGDAPLVANNPAAALALADDLARLMDDMTTRSVPWERLDELVPDELDQYWQLTLRVPRRSRARHWPASLPSAARSSRRRGATC